jgi:hypothetical protein
VLCEVMKALMNTSVLTNKHPPPTPLSRVPIIPDPTKNLPTLIHNSHILSLSTHPTLTLLLTLTS